MSICLLLVLIMEKKCPGRPQRFRWVENLPEITRFSPSGDLLEKLEQVRLTVDELEAMRLADLQGLYQEQAAKKLRVSRQTFGRIIASAHKKVAEALVTGKAIIIEGGEIAAREELQPMGAGGYCVCPRCDARIHHIQGKPCQEEICQKCGKTMIRERSFHHQKLMEKKKKDR